MSLFSKPPWYVAGLAFECIQCGRCCAGPEEGYVWCNDREIANMAALLKMPEPEFRKKYIRKVRSRTTIVERPDNHDCVFLIPNGQGGKGCRVYSARPAQCRTWPFWPANLSSERAWALAQMRCPGLNRGQVFAFEEIEQRRLATQS